MQKSDWVIRSMIIQNSGTGEEDFANHLAKECFGTVFRFRDFVVFSLALSPCLVLDIPSSNLESSADFLEALHFMIVPKGESRSQKSDSGSSREYRIENISPWNRRGILWQRYPPTVRSTLFFDNFLSIRIFFYSCIRGVEFANTLHEWVEDNDPR